MGWIPWLTSLVTLLPVTSSLTKVLCFMHVLIFPIAWTFLLKHRCTILFIGAFSIRICPTSNCYPISSFSLPILKTNIPQLLATPSSTCIQVSKLSLIFCYTLSAKPYFPWYVSTPGSSPQPLVQGFCRMKTGSFSVRTLTACATSTKPLFYVEALLFQDVNVIMSFN